GSADGSTVLCGLPEGEEPPGDRRIFIWVCPLDQGLKLRVRGWGTALHPEDGGLRPGLLLLPQRLERRHEVCAGGAKIGTRVEGGPQVLCRQLIQRLGGGWVRFLSQDAPDSIRLAPVIVIKMGPARIEAQGLGRMA